MSASIRAALLAIGLVAIAIPMFFGASPALACSCAGGTEADHFERATAVFAGTLVERNAPTSTAISGDERVVLTYRVTSVYKGRDVRASESISTTLGGGLCGLDGTVNTTYLVFATGPAGARTANICGGTRPLDGREPAFGPGSPVGTGTTAAPSPPPTGLPPIGPSPTTASDLLIVGLVGLGVIAVGIGAFAVRERRESRSADASE